MMSNMTDHRLDRSYLQAVFSDCGSFCFLKYRFNGVVIVGSKLLEKRQVEMRLPAVWGSDTSYNGRLYTWRRMSAILQLSQTPIRPQRKGLRKGLYWYSRGDSTVALNVTGYPRYLANTQEFLLAGENGDDLVRILFLPLSGQEGPPVIKHLRVTMNQILAKLEETAKSIEPNYEELSWREGDETSDEEESVPESEEEDSVWETEEEDSVLESEDGAISADEEAFAHSPIID